MVDNKEQDETEIEMSKAIKELTCPLLKTRLVALTHQALEKEKLDKAEESEMNAIKKKYEALMSPFLEQQQEIISGKRAPLVSELEGLEEILGAVGQEALDDQSGINGFWLRAMRNSDVLGEEIKETDVEVLKSLANVQVIRHYKSEETAEKLVLKFTFNQNDYFTNEVLEKVLVMDERDARPVSSTATEIQWKEGKNLTTSVVKKQQVHKKSGEKRTVQKSVDTETFFHLFSAVDVQEDTLDKLEEEEVEQAVERMDIDWNIAEQLEEEIVPYSVEYYLNVISKMPEDYDGSEEDEDEDDLPKPKGKKKCPKECC